jgi:hypothetical protein
MAGRAAKGSENHAQRLLARAGLSASGPRVLTGGHLRCHEPMRQGGTSRSILIIVFVRDPCSKQLDSHRLAADVPKFTT